jgi:hypothetical protein
MQTLSCCGLLPCSLLWCGVFETLRTVAACKAVSSRHARKPACLAACVVLAALSSLDWTRNQCWPVGEQDTGLGLLHAFALCDLSSLTRQGLGLSVCRTLGCGC